EHRRGRVEDRLEAPLAVVQRRLDALAPVDVADAGHHVRAAVELEGPQADLGPEPTAVEPTTPPLDRSLALGQRVPQVQLRVRLRVGWLVRAEIGDRERERLLGR